MIEGLGAAREAVNEAPESAYDDGDGAMVRALVGLYLRLCKK